ncbi:hypothetical protein R1flu_007912 [Riccia fluitans]|uniref:Ribosomal protein S12 n=1 Tax=Riccia fluitans TaxID=41844 RepID=A0ABD1Z0E5_9MARC
MTIFIPRLQAALRKDSSRALRKPRKQSGNLRNLSQGGQPCKVPLMRVCRISQVYPTFLRPGNLWAST